jgi:hypothetical protein
VSHTIPWRIILILVSFFALGSAASVAADEVYRFRPGLHLSREHPLNKDQIKGLLDGLRFWSGLCEIRFDAEGDLRLGDRSQILAGSNAARELIFAAVDSRDSFSIEDASASPAIAFAQIEPTETYVVGSDPPRNGWQVRIDFSDFDQLKGNAEARRAFDPAISLLHELTHGVLDCLDPTDPGDELGAAERYINRIRADLGLPQRRHYYPRTRIVDGLLKQSEFTFACAQPNTPERKELIIAFDLNRVFDVTKAKSRAAAQASLLAMKHARRD